MITSHTLLPYNFTLVDLSTGVATMSSLALLQGQDAEGQGNIDVTMQMLSMS